jgi:CAAX prenyl protease-like protein
MAPTAYETSIWREDVAVAALALQPFALILAATLMLRGITSEELAAADPLIQLLGAKGILAVPVLSLAIGAIWWGAARPGRAALRRGARQGTVAVLIVAVGLPLLRLAIGPSLPTFIPPEESARPGLAGGLAAGVFEESLFRVLLLPALLACLSDVRSMRSFVVASLIVGLAFALSHEIGPGAARFHLAYFVDRFVLPGLLMSLACRWPGFTFVVGWHCAAHTLLPFVFD